MQEAPHVLSGIPFMLRCSFDILPLALPLPQFWVPAVIIIISAVIAYRHRATATPRLAFDLATLALVPIAILLLGLVSWEAVRAGTGWEWQFMAMYVGLLVQIVLSVALIWRHRSHLALAMCVTLFCALWTAGAAFVSSMAITGTWL